MDTLHRWLDLVAGSDPKLRRMLGYYLATVLYYLFCGALLWMQVGAGVVARGTAVVLSVVAGVALAAFYLLTRLSARLHISPSQLALAQAQFGMVATLIGYTVMGPLRGALLMVLLVVMVFCAFSLRPRQTNLLCGSTIALLGVTVGVLVATDPARFPLYVEALHFALTSVSLVAVARLTGQLSKLRAHMKRQKEDLLDAMATIRTLATVDELTSLANRRHMHDVLEREERRQGAHGRVCMALLDIDFFKNVNDRYGHAGGDAVLRTFAAAARAELRSADVLARWGGEEFLLLLPETELGEAELALKRMAARVAAMRVPEVDAGLTITFSAGVVGRRAREPFADAIKRADDAMYLAKGRGRNCIVAHD